MLGRVMRGCRHSDPLATPQLSAASCLDLPPSRRYIPRTFRQAVSAGTSERHISDWLNH